MNFEVEYIKFIPNIPMIFFPFWLLEKFFLILANENTRVYEAFWSQLFPISEYEIKLRKLE